jgi:hypothetical protein
MNERPDDTVGQAGRRAGATAGCQKVLTQHSAAPHGACPVRVAGAERWGHSGGSAARWAAPLSAVAVGSYQLHISARPDTAGSVAR